MAEEEEAYGGLPGAVRYSYATSDSRLFRSFVAVGTLVTLFVAVIFVSGVVNLIAATADAGGGTLTTVRAFFVVVSLAVVAPVLAPMLVVARRTRRGAAPAPGRQRTIALAGYGYLLALYLGLVVWAPDPAEPAATGVAGGVVAALNALPDAWAVGPPVAATAVLALLLRSSGS